MIGRTLRQYKIVERLGEGGMGVVYLAEDTVLGRRVALKMLSEKFTGMQEPLQRFLSEARLASSFNHPNIVSVYELGEEQGQRFIAMEYVPGRSLRGLLETHGLPLKKLLDFAGPAAEALARAHRAGVIHRDIKPENLLVSEDGYIKVADFGLAKLKPSRAADAAVTDEVLTVAGSVVGTAGYVSPETLQGQEADARSDVFSFGVVLYEMATGNSPFKRNSAANTAAAILRDTPPGLRSAAKNAPAELERIVSKALEKEPDYRYQSMEELATDLRRLRRDFESGRIAEPTESAVPSRAAGDWKMPAAAGAIVVLLAAVGWLGWRMMKTPSGPGAARVIQFTALPGLEDSPTWSPDGRSIAYVSDAAGQLDIYVQQISGGRAIRLTDSDADDAQPAWSLDGSQIAFVSARAYPVKRLSTMLNMGQAQPFFAGRNGDVWVMPALGGTARRIAEDAYYPAWSPDGKQLVYQASRGGQWVLLVSRIDGGSEPRMLASGELTAAVTTPAWSPDGKWIAYCKGSSFGGGVIRGRVLVMPSSGGTPVAGTTGDSTALMPAWSPDGRWLYFSSDRGGALNLWKARFNGSGLMDYEQVTAGAGSDISARPDPTGTRLAYSSVQVSLDIWQHNLATHEAKRLTSETTQEDNPSPSPDGKWVALTSNRRGAQGLWLLSMEDGSLAQVSSGVQTGLASHWSRDGRYLYFTSRDFKSVWRYEIAAGNATKILYVEGTNPFFTISPDDRFVVMQTLEQGLTKADLSTGKIETLVKNDEGLAHDPAFSPDGQWVAFYRQNGNDRKIWVIPSAGGMARQLTFGVSEDSHPSWSPDGRFIYFGRNHQDIFVVPFQGGEPKPITNYHSFSILLDYPVATADGKKIIFTRNDKGGDIFLLETPNEQNSIFEIRKMLRPMIRSASKQETSAPLRG
ncbi:MAG TPA: protein kinase [Candidatus Acidoferrales bacterium]|nr:protein kinase [Candidatus Acidoferrales bacterium]